MSERLGYSPLPSRSANNIKFAWKEYVISVGLEGQELYNYIKKGLSEEVALQEIDSVRLDRSQLRVSWNNSRKLNNR